LDTARVGNELVLYPSAQDSPSLLEELAALPGVSVWTANDTQGAATEVILALGSSGAVAALSQVVRTWLLARVTTIEIYRRGDLAAVVRYSPATDEETIRAGLARLAGVADDDSGH